MQRGKFITFEGSEGCGKSTQIRLLVEHLQARGLEIVLTREPGGTVVGEKIRHLLQYDPESANLTDESELLLFAASRAQLVRELILPALEEGKWVVADRFFDSTTIYQGVGRGLDPGAVRAINAFAVGAAVPDLTILFDLDAATGHARAVKASGSKEDRMESEPLAFFEAVRQGYLKLAAAEPERIAVVDASAGIAEVTDSVYRLVESRFPRSDS